MSQDSMVVVFTVMEPGKSRVIHRETIYVDDFARNGTGDTNAAIVAAHHYRAGFLTGQGWTLSKLDPVPGGCQGQATTPYGGYVNWTIAVA